MDSLNYSFIVSFIGKTFNFSGGSDSSVCTVFAVRPVSAPRTGVSNGNQYHDIKALPAAFGKLCTVILYNSTIPLSSFRKEMKTLPAFVRFAN